MSEIMQYKLLRIQKRIRQKEVAKALGVHPSYVSMFEDEKVSWDKTLEIKYKKIITEWDQ